MKRAAVWAALAMLAGCASKQSMDYCDEMKKTGKEIVSIQEQNVDLKEKMDAVPEGTDSTEYLRSGYQQQIDKNNEKVKYLKTFNEANAKNCSPTWEDPAMRGKDY